MQVRAGPDRSSIMRCSRIDTPTVDHPHIDHMDAAVLDRPALLASMERMPKM